MSASLALALRNITKRFGATVALDGATCEVRRGTVHALLGENGAGKTTLMRLAFGLLSPDAGTVEVSGAAVHFRSSGEAIAAGLGMVHQHFMLVPAFTVAENVALGAPSRLTARDAAARIRQIATETGLAVDPDAIVGVLPVSAQQRVEIVRALVHRASLLILDEPTAVLAPAEAAELYRWLRRFAATGGTAVLITHRLADALAVADEITVLRQGRTVLAARTDALSEDRLVRAVVGDEALPARPAQAEMKLGEVLFALDRATVVDSRGVTRLHPTTLEIRAGEVLGVLGVEGSGHRELLRLLAGRLAPSSGRVTRPISVGFIPEDRLRDAVLPSRSLVENHALAGAGARRGRLDWAAIADETRRTITAFDVRTATASAPLRSLSGGNQQRFVVGRERAVAATLIAENPARGLDVRAAARVLETVASVAHHVAGAAVIYSADLDEVLPIATRVVVCAAGRVREVAPAADAADRTPFARALVGLEP